MSILQKSIDRTPSFFHKADESTIYSIRMEVLYNMKEGGNEIENFKEIGQQYFIEKLKMYSTYLA